MCEIICKSAKNFFIPFAVCFLVATTGETNVSLTNECWGKVRFCMGGKCGGVCKDTWTDADSVMLCKNLGCGDKILTANKDPGAYDVIIKSLHATAHTTNLTQCNFIQYNEGDTTCNHNPAYVVCLGNELFFKIFTYVKKTYNHNFIVFILLVKLNASWIPTITDHLNPLN